MALDRDGNVVALGDVFVLAGTVRRIDGDTLVVVLDSGKAMRVDAGDVVPIDALGGGAGVTAHNALTGLGADDHTQYVLANGTRAFSAAVLGVDSAGAASLTTRGYLDGQISTLSLYALSVFQPLDATLTALAGLTTAAGKVTKWTGVDTATTITLGAFGETMLATATAAAGRAALAVDEVYSDAPMQAINVNVVAYTDLVSKSLTVEAGDTIEIEARGTLRNDSAVVRTYRVQAIIAVLPNFLQCEVIDGGTLAFNATNQAEWWIRATFSVKNASSSGCTVEVDRSVPGAANTGQNTAATTVRRGWQVSTSDFTGAATVGLRMRSDNATATQVFTLHSWKLTRKPQRL
jgi:hypothetical protein